MRLVYLPSPQSVLEHLHHFQKEPHTLDSHCPSPLSPPSHTSLCHHRFAYSGYFIGDLTRLQLYLVVQRLASHYTSQLLPGESFTSFTEEYQVWGVRVKAELSVPCTQNQGEEWTSTVFCWSHFLSRFQTDRSLALQSSEPLCKSERFQATASSSIYSSIFQKYFEISHLVCPNVHCLPHTFLLLCAFSLL